LASTAAKRETLSKINSSLSTLEDIKEDKAIQDIWKAYTKKFDYAEDITFDDIIAALVGLFEMYNS
jgi:hypothetical protein